MNHPNVRTSLKDARSGVTYHVMAYRKLSDSEMVGAIRMYLAKSRKRPKRGDVVTINTIIGYSE